jgi:hypothetical protein
VKRASTVLEVFILIERSFYSNFKDQILKEQLNSIDHPDKGVILDYLHSSAYQQTGYANAPLGNKAGIIVYFVVTLPC